jgi:anti-anti-sigma factor
VSVGRGSAPSTHVIVGTVDRPVTFAATVAPRDGELVVLVRGEVDLDTAPRLRAVIDEALAQSPRLVIDLSRTSFIDSTGLALLLEAHSRLGGRPESVVVRSPSVAASHLLRVSGVDRIVTIEHGAATSG